MTPLQYAELKQKWKKMFSTKHM